MSKINFIHVDELEFVNTREFIDSEFDPEDSATPRNMPGAQQDGTLAKVHVPGGPDEMQLFEVRFEPDLKVMPHAHAESEIVHVLEGELIFGSRRFPAGSTVHIPGMTLYSFSAGPTGCRFLNFRARRDWTYFPKDRFLEMTRGSTAAGDGESSPESGVAVGDHP